MFAPTSLAWLDVGGGVPDAPGILRDCNLGRWMIFTSVRREGSWPLLAIGRLCEIARADMESAPTGNHKFAITQGCTGRRRLAAKTMAASQQSWPARAVQCPTGALIAARPRNAAPYG